MSTKKDLERSARDQKTYQHNAAKAMIDALGFRLLPVSKEAAPVVEIPAKGKETPAKKAA